MTPILKSAIEAARAKIDNDNAGEFKKLNERREAAQAAQAAVEGKIYALKADQSRWESLLIERERLRKHLSDLISIKEMFANPDPARLGTFIEQCNGVVPPLVLSTLAELDAMQNAGKWFDILIERKTQELEPLQRAIDEMAARYGLDPK